MHKPKKPKVPGIKINPVLWFWFSVVNEQAGEE